MPPLPRHRDAVLAGVMSIEGSGQAIQAVLIVLAKILGNVSREPAEMKYRTLKLSNKMIQKGIGEGAPSHPHACRSSLKAYD